MSIFGGLSSFEDNIYKGPNARRGGGGWAYVLHFTLSINIVCQKWWTLKANIDIAKDSDV